MDNKILEKIKEIADLFIIMNNNDFFLFVKNNKWCIKNNENLIFESNSLENLIKMLKKHLENEKSQN